MSKSKTKQPAALNPADITPGDWVQGKRTDTKEWTQIFANNKIVAEVQPINKRGNRQQGDFDKEDANVKAICTAVNSTYKKGLNPEAFEEVVNVLKQFLHSVEHEGVVEGRVVDSVRNAKSALQKARGAIDSADITPAFNYQRIDPEDNLPDLEKWVKEDKMVGLIDEEMGGIIGYIHQDHIDRITAILNTSKG